MSAPVRVDTRGMRCPWPALRAARAMRGCPADGVVEILFDDPQAEREIAALARAEEWLIRKAKSGGAFTISH